MSASVMFMIIIALVGCYFVFFKKDKITKKIETKIEDQNHILELAEKTKELDSEKEAKAVKQIEEAVKQ